MSEKVWSDEAWDDYLYWQNQDKKTLKRINNLIKDIERNGPLTGIGEPEALKSAFSAECLAGTHIKNARSLIPRNGRFLYNLILSCNPPQRLVVIHLFQISRDFL